MCPMISGVMDIEHMPAFDADAIDKGKRNWRQICHQKGNRSGEYDLSGKEIYWIS